MKSPQSHLGVRIGWLVLAAPLAACGSASTAASPPKSSVEEAAPGASASEPADEARREPRTLAEAEQWLEDARTELDRFAVNDVAPATAASEAPQVAPAPPSSGARAEAAKDAAAEAPARPQSREAACETTCKAFASLERASDAVCRLDDTGGERCQRARTLRAEAARRVAACACTR